VAAPISPLLITCRWERSTGVVENGVPGTGLRRTGLRPQEPTHERCDSHSSTLRRHNLPLL